MKYKKGLILICLIICFFSIASVVAADANETIDVNQNDELMAVETQEVNDDEVTDDIVSNEDDNDNLEDSNHDEDVLGDYPPYNKYTVRVDDTTVNYGSGGSVVMHITPCSGYTYAYDFYLKIYDSSGAIKLNKRFYSTSLDTSRSCVVGSGELTPGTYNIKIYNNYDNKIMDTAKLTIKSTANTLPYSAYSVSVSDTTMTYGSSGSISMSISPASSSYNYKYNFYLKVYDKNNVEKISNQYSGTSASYSKTYTINPNKLSVGVYTIKLVNHDEGKVMATAKLTVKSSDSSICPSYLDYTVSVYDTTIDYGSSGSISMKISPASDSEYKYYYYLKVYDSNNNERISQVYSGNTPAYSKSYTVSSDQLSSGIYTVKIVNFYDDEVMSTAKLTVKSSYYPSYSDYSVYVDDTSINYGSGGSIFMKITSSSKNYKYNYYLKVYDSNGVEKISQKYSDTKTASSKTYNVGSNQLAPGNYTIKIINIFDDGVMSTAKLTVKPAYPSYSEYNVSVSDTDIYYESGGSIPMNISPSSSTYKYYYYLKVYDSMDNEMISQLYYSTYPTDSKTYDVGSAQLAPGEYNIRIINYCDNNVMSVAKLNILKITLETMDITAKCDEMIQYKVRASENGKYKSGLIITFNFNGNEKSVVTDNQGYATLKIHLKAGNYDVTVNCGNIVNENTIKVKKVYVKNKYKNAYVKSSNGYYKGKNKIKYGWKGNLEGYFKIYKGKKLVYKTKFNSNGYIDDYFKYKSHNKQYKGSAIKNVGTYKAVITTLKGKVIAKTTLKIKKAKTRIKAKSFKAVVYSKRNVKVKILDKSGSRKNIGGKAKLKINGKTYKVKVKKGIAQKKVKLPSRVKTLKCSVKYSGDKNHKASSGKFKIKVIKLSSILDAYCPVTRVGKKVMVDSVVGVKDLNGEYHLAKKGFVKYTIAGKTYKAKVKKGYAKITIPAPSKAKTYKCKAVYLGGKTVKSSKFKFKMQVKKPVSKYKVITTTAKYYELKKYSGRFMVVTQIYDMTAGYMAPYKYVDTFLYKDGKMVKNSKYSVKYQINGHWTGWTKYGTTSTSHHRHAVPDGASVGHIKVKVKKNVNSFLLY